MATRTLPSKGIVRQVIASTPLPVRMDGREVVPGLPVPTDGLY